MWMHKRYQLKILSAALMSVLILQKKISRIKWVALGLLTAGVACVTISSMPSAKVMMALYGSGEDDG